MFLLSAKGLTPFWAPQYPKNCRDLCWHYFELYLWQYPKDEKQNTLLCQSQAELVMELSHFWDRGTHWYYQFHRTDLRTREEVITLLHTLGQFAGLYMASLERLEKKEGKNPKITHNLSTSSSLKGYPGPILTHHSRYKAHKRVSLKGKVILDGYRGHLLCVNSLGCLPS